MASHDDFELTQPKRVILRRLFGAARPLWPLLVGGIAVGMVVSALGLVGPYLGGRGISAALASIESGGVTRESFQPVVRLVVVLLVAGLQIVLQYVSQILMGHLRLRILTDLRKRLYRSLLRQSFAFFDRRDSGQLINRTIGDVRMMQKFYTTVLVQGAQVLFTLVGYSAAMIWLDAYVAAVAVPFVPVYVVSAVLFMRRVHPLFHDMRHEHDNATSILSENVQGIQVVRAFGREPEERARYEGTLQQILAKWGSISHVFGVYRPVVDFLGQVSLLAMIGMAAYRVLHGALAAGAILTVFLWGRMVTGQMRTIARMIGAVDHGFVSAERVFEILDARREVASPKDALPMPEGRGRVTFEGVTFGYDAAQPVLKDVDVDIPPGTNVALVGPTASGKSSFIKLLPRFYDPQEGRIRIDGADVRDLNLRDVRAEIGFVFQDTFLFSASLTDDIAYGVPEAEQRAVEDAARRAQVDDFARAFEDGYGTLVGERGISLSGGQRQRVAIARALLVDPRILILDDATASVDSATERSIQDALAEVMRNRTTFIIAHRVSTVRRADLTLVLEHGRVVQQGRHDELVCEKGPYREFCEMQLHLGLADEEELS